MGARQTRWQLQGHGRGRVAAPRPSPGFLEILLCRARFVRPTPAEASQPNRPSVKGIRNELKMTPSWYPITNRVGYPADLSCLGA